MTLTEFAKITTGVIARDGFDDYLPTAAYPDRREIVVLEDVPEDVDVESAARRWAFERANEGEEVLVAFKVSPTRFKVVRQYEGRFEEQEFDAAPSDA